MAKFNYIENYLAKQLNRFPAIKQMAKKGYQTLNYLVYKKDYKLKTDFKLKKIGIGNNETFFGYYDKSPVNSINTHLIYHSTELSTLQKPNGDIPIDVILYNLKEDKVVKSFQTFAYNWQQGAKLQWLDEIHFIFNDFDKNNNCYISRKINIENLEETVFKMPIYDCFKSDYGLSLNFDKLNIFRPDYGYRNRKVGINDLPDYDNDGIVYLDLKTDEQKLIVKLSDLIQLDYSETMKDAVHLVNHIMISPDGEKFMFMHRWFLPNGRRYDRLLVCNRESGNLQIIADDEMVSHCYWQDNNTVIGYLRNNGIDGFYQIDINNTSTVVLSEKFKRFSDGHPSVSGKRILFDTYPDKSRMKQLFIYDMDNDNLQHLGEFFESLKFYGETRCDLHPKWSLDGESIFVDSVHEGKRGLYLIDYHS